MARWSVLPNHARSVGSGGVGGELGRWTIEAASGASQSAPGDSPLELPGCDRISSSFTRNRDSSS
jgi:hypothetical protein